MPRNTHEKRLYLNIWICHIADNNSKIKLTQSENVISQLYSQILLFMVNSSFLMMPTNVPELASVSETSSMAGFDAVCEVSCMGRDSVSRYPMGRDSVSRYPMGRDSMASDSMGGYPMGRDSMNRDVSHFVPSCYYCSTMVDSHIFMVANGAQSNYMRPPFSSYDKD